MFRRFLALVGSGFAFGVGLIIALGIVITVLAYAVIMRGDDEGGKVAIFPRPDTDRAVAIVPLEGEIVRAEKFVRTLQKVVADKKVKAIVVRIDSPGGGVGASEEIYREILRARDKKPVVCSLGGVAASGGLYASMGCKTIVTQAGTITGSIGVIYAAPMVSEVLGKIGVSMSVVKSGQFKDTGSPFRPMNDEDRKLLQGVIDQSYSQFIGVIAQARGLTEEAVRKFADGRVFVGAESIKLGLADEVGGVFLAAQRALEAAGVTGQEPELLYPAKNPGFLSNMFGAEEEILLSIKAALFEPRYLY